MWVVQVASQNCYAQDTVFVNDKSLDSPITYGARDSIYADLKNNLIYLYGEARVAYEATTLEAGYIVIDLNKQEVLATHVYDSDSNKIELPTLKGEQEDVTASSIKYNFGTEKAYIKDVRTKQDEFYLYMETAKRLANDQIHFRGGEFTTCNLEEPHYHFQLTKAVLIPEKRIASGPLNLWLKGVPTPLGIPFAMIPQQKEKSKGLIFPNFVPVSSFGFGVQDLGYYQPINDSLQTTFYGSIYSRGTFGIRNVTDYQIKYKFSGAFDLRFDLFRLGFPDTINAKKLSVLWSHRQDPKANPFWQFNSNVNFQSDSDPKFSTNAQNPQYFNNTIYSDINLLRLFPGKPFSAGLKTSVRQNSIDSTVTLTAPALNFNVTRVKPFGKLFPNTRKMQFVKQFSFNYNFEGINKSTFNSTLLRDGDLSTIGKTFVNGFRNNTVIQTTASTFSNSLKINPSITYNNAVNFQQTRLLYDSVSNSSIRDTLYQTGLDQSLSASINLTSVVYSYYRTIGKNKPIMRHIATPSLGFSYIPNLGSTRTDSVGLNMAPIEYSVFQQSAYNFGVQREQALLTFSLSNTLELKKIDRTDTVSGFKKIKLIDQLSFNGSYDMMKESMNLSNINVNFRTTPAKFVSFVANGTFSPYAQNDTTGAITDEYALAQNGRLGRFINSNFTTTITLTSKESRKKLEENQDLLNETWNSDYQYFALHPERMLDFDIPYKLNISHVYNINANLNRTDLNPERQIFVQTLALNGDLSFTKRWKLAGTMNFDFKTAKLTYTQLQFSRDMHCWALDFSWVPLGANQSFVFRISATSALFQNAKINFTKPPLFF